MSIPRLASVNVGLTRTLEQKPRLVSAIDKLPARGPVEAGNLCLAGDEVGHPKIHGGTYQAIHAFAGEDLTWWTQQLGRYVRPGVFGENLTTLDIDLNSCIIGEQWWLGTARLQVTSVRTPCDRFQRWMGLEGFDNTDWTQRFTKRGRPGIYLSILDRGWIQEGDMISVIEQPTHGLTAGTMFRAQTTEPALLPLLLEVEGLPPRAYEQAEKYVASAAR